jgi:hypothetical protein
MNERIKEMSKQAHLVADATYAKAPDAIWLKEYNKKFAELIVKECASVVNSRDDSDTGFWANIIKEHFGVEE